MKPRTAFGGVGKAAIARVSTLPITAAAGLLTSALVIAHTGSVGFAAISVASTLPQLIPYADLGVGAGVVNVISQTGHRTAQARSAVASAVRTVLVSALMVVALSLSGTVFFSWSTVLGIGDAGIQNMDWAVAWALILFAATMPLSLGQRVLVGMSRNHVAILSAALGPVIGLGLTAALIAGDAQPWLLALPPAAGLLIASGLSTGIAARALHFRPHWITDLSLRTRGILSQGAAFTISTVAVSLMLPLGRVILARQSSLEQVAAYSLVLQLYLPAMSIVSAATISLWPHFARKRSDGTHSAGLILKVSSLFAGFGAVGAVFFYILGPLVGQLISGGEVSTSSGTYLAAGLLLIVQSAQLVIGMALTSLRGLWFQALFSIPMGLAAFFAVSLFGSSLGAVAPFLAAAASLVLFALVPGIARVLVVRDGTRL